MLLIHFVLLATQLAAIAARPIDAHRRSGFALVGTNIPGAAPIVVVPGTEAVGDKAIEKAAEDAADDIEDAAEDAAEAAEDAAEDAADDAVKAAKKAAKAAKKAAKDAVYGEKKDKAEAEENGDPKEGNVEGEVAVEAGNEVVVEAGGEVVVEEGGEVVVDAGDAPPGAGDITGAFGVAIPLLGGEQKTDILFPVGTTGAFEVEYQSSVANTVTVTENAAPNPLSAPTGFAFLEAKTFVVVLAESAAGSTLQKIDFIFDAASAEGVVVSQAVIGKFCAEAGAFAVSAALGEIEFEVEENEVTLTVADLNGEWGIFIPAGAAAPPAEAPLAEAPPAEEAPAEAPPAEEAPTEAPPAEAPPAEAPPTAEGEVKEGGEANGQEIVIQGVFGEAAASTADVKTDVVYPAGASGAFEVEVKSAAANSITVVKNDNPVAPPAGFVFVDPSTFQVTISAATTAGDLTKIDYFFSAEVAAATDVTKGVIGKLDPATNTFITDLTVLEASFEVEIEENEWTLTVPDLNGEWAILMPTSAVVQAAPAPMPMA